MSDDLAILIDGRPLRHYPLGQAGFSGGTESYVRRLAHGLAERGHTVHVLTSDLQHEEQRGPTEWWWPESYHPMRADVVMAAHSLETIGDLQAPILVFLPNGVDSPLFGRGALVDAVCCFSQCHVDLLTRIRPELPADRCHVTGLGVELSDYPAEHGQHVRGRMLWANDPARGLLQTIDIFEAVQQQVPEATLHVAYDFDQQFRAHQWGSDAMSEIMWKCKRRMEENPEIVNLGALSHGELVREQVECHVHAMPSDPPNIGSQIHGLTQMELAAAGVPLVLSDIEAFPEVFSAAADLLPVVGCLRASYGDGDLARVTAQDWADQVVAVMNDEARWQAQSAASRALAERHTWDSVVDRVDGLLAALVANHMAAAAA